MITCISENWKEDIIAEYAKHPEASMILEGNIPHEYFKVHNDIILYKGRVFLTPRSKMKEIILKEYHNNPMAGHQGYFKTYKQIREKFSWKGLKKDV